MPNSILYADTTDTAYRGRFTSLPSHMIPEGFSPYLKNVDLTRQLGTMMKRKGIALESVGPVDAFTRVSGLHQYIPPSGSTVVWAAAGNSVYDTTVSGAWVPRFTGAMGGLNVNFETFNGLTIAVSETETTQKSTGGAYSVLLGSPPANVKHIRKFKNRVLFFNHSAGRDRLSWTAPGDPENFTVESGAGFQDLNRDDGDEGTGIGTCGGIAVLLKRRSAHIMSGIGPPSDTFAFRPIAVAGGCISGRSVVEMGNMVVYLSETGVYGISEAGVWADLSPNITPTIAGIPLAAKMTACAGQLGRIYILNYDANGDGINDTAEALDVENGTWAGPWDMKANVFARLLDGSLLSGASDIKNLRRHNSGEDDEGAAIEMIIRSRGNDGGALDATKYPEEFWVEGQPIAGKTLNVRTRVDGVQIDSQSISIAPTQISGTDRDVFVRYANLPDSPNARIIETEIHNNELAAPCRIYRYRATMKDLEGQKVQT